MRGPFVYRTNQTVFHHPRIQECADEFEHTFIGHTLCDTRHQTVVVDSVERRHDRLPITKTIRIRSSSLVNGMYLKGVGSLSSGASQDGVFLSFL